MEKVINRLILCSLEKFKLINENNKAFDICGEVYNGYVIFGKIIAKFEETGQK